MTPTTTTVDTLNQLDPWGFGTGGDDQATFVEVVQPLDEPVDDADLQMLAAAGALPLLASGGPLASIPASAPPATLGFMTTSPGAVPASWPDPPRVPRRDDWLMRLPFPSQMLGVLGMFAVVIMAQAFYIGFSLTGEASARPDLGEVIVSSQPSGAEVKVDGAVLGSTPLVMPLAAGAHRLELTHAGSQPALVSADVTAGQRVSHHVVLAAALAPAPSLGALRVDTGAAAAQVFVDGILAGATPLARAELTAGAHAVRVEFRGGAAIERQVTIPAGESLSLVLDAPPARASVPAGPVSGWVHVDSSFDVDVRRNNELIGTSASARIMLPAGPQVLELVNDALGFRVLVKTTVAAGRVATVQLDTPRVPVAINAQPWAEVVVDGRVHGETPLANLMLPIGVHRVALRHPELGERTETVTVRASGANRISADLRKAAVR